jgi:hypothetical protein
MKNTNYEAHNYAILYGLLFLKSKYSSLHSVFKHPRTVSALNVRKEVLRKYSSGQNDNFVYFNLYYSRSSGRSVSIETGIRVGRPRLKSR